MGSASRSALASARATLDATAVDRAAGEQLLAASRVIASSHALQSALSSGDEAGARGLRGRVFADLGAPARTVLDAALDAAWSSASELVAGVEELGIRAVAVSASDPGAVAREVYAFGQLVAENAELELALSGTRASADERAAVVERLLNGRASAEAVAILTHLVRLPRGRRIGELVRVGSELVADAAGKGLATVLVASPLTDAQRASVASLVQSRYGREHLVVEQVDTGVIGGIRIQVGHEVIDGSIAARLADLTLQLAR